jgi:KaiC/GvpD/RAD55 family RecA-like ATPase
MKRPEFDINLEASLIRYCEECKLDGREHGLTQEDFSFPEMKKCFSEVEARGFAMMPIGLDDAISTQAYIENTVLPKLKEYKARVAQWDALISDLKATVDPDTDFSQNSGSRSLQSGLESARKVMLGSPKGICGDGWVEFMDVIGGFREGTLHGIVAETGGGKTTFALNLFNDILKKHQDLKTMVFSLEMDEAAFTRQLAKINGNMTQSELIWRINNDDNFDLFKSVDYHGWNNAIFDYDTGSLRSIISLINQKKPKLVFIDHAQFIEMEGNSEGSWMKKMCRDLKQCAKKSGSAIVILSQIDKSAAKTFIGSTGKDEQKRPRLVDALGGISFKSSLDSGMVIWRRQQHSIVFYDKVREPFMAQNMFKDFDIYIDGAKGKISGVEPRHEDEQ